MLKLPDFVKNCMKTLNDAGYESFCVGGAVRDSILRRRVSDFDVATDCLPEDIMKLFPHTVPTGILHGTVTVVTDDGNIEVTTYRTDGGYADGRHPDSVSYVKSIKEDLARRDFTVNAIAFNEQIGIYDPFSGYADIQNKCLRTVGDAHLRFSEDALRILRLFRFSSQLGFNIEEKTLTAACELKDTLKKVSAERIREELLKLICGEYIENAQKLFSIGALRFLGINDFDVTKIVNIKKDVICKLCAMLYASNSDPAAVCDALKLSNKQKKDVKNTMLLLSQEPPKTKADIKRMLNIAGIDSFKAYLAVNYRQSTEKLLEEIIKNDEPYTQDRLKIDGNDLKKCGVSGKQIGEVLNMLLSKVIEDPEKNEKNTLINLITK